MKKKPQQDRYRFLDTVIGLGGEGAEVAKKIKQEYIEGKEKVVPWMHLECHDWESAILYAFRRGWLHPDNFIKKSGDKITDVSWAGLDFNDKIVVALEKIVARIGVNYDLKELRLFTTGFSQKGLNKLQAIFPNAKITLFDKKQEEENPNLLWIKCNDV